MILVITNPRQSAIKPPVWTRLIWVMLILQQALGNTMSTNTGLLPFHRVTSKPWADRISGALQPAIRPADLSFTIKNAVISVMMLRVKRMVVGNNHRLKCEAKNSIEIGLGVSVFWSVGVEWNKYKTYKLKLWKLNLVWVLLCAGLMSVELSIVHPSIHSFTHPIFMEHRLWTRL